MDVEKCPGCGAPVRWVLWRREQWTEDWEPVAEGTETEVKRGLAAVPFDEKRYVYTYTRPCEEWPPRAGD